ncbi:MAG: hypothetical protein OEN02_03105 [Gammaproteobacteria bacterium]|nr:hypothetical protein [Gammaproteobacteria bacterium]MDH3536687.1 hypothetical protein [Gammaproteobacteria bacterium]
MTEINSKPVRILLQAFNYGLFMALIWYFASAPSVRILDDDEAVITIAFAHAGQLREPCRRLSQQELDELAPNMRKPEDCPRQRSPVTIEAWLDGEPFYSASLPPPGLFGDGGVDVFHSAKITAGTHRLSLRMNDSVRIEGFNHGLEREVRVDPAQILLVGFQSERGFVLKDGLK